MKFLYEVVAVTIMLGAVIIAIAGVLNLYMAVRTLKDKDIMFAIIFAVYGLLFLFGATAILYILLT